MKYILKNLNRFFNEDKLVFILILICSFSASVIIYFAYGVGFNFSMQKKAGETTSYELSIQYKELQKAKSEHNENYKSIAAGMNYFTFSKLKSLISELDPMVFLNCTSMYTAVGYSSEYASVHFDNSGSMTVSNLCMAEMYYTYDHSTGLFSITKNMEQLFNPYSLSCTLIDGKGITNEDFVNCNAKAVVGAGIFNDLYVDGKKRSGSGYNSDYSFELGKTKEPTVRIGGTDYIISGISSGSSVLIPVSAMGDDDKISTFFPEVITFCYNLPVTHEQYTRTQNIINEKYSDVLTVKELEFAEKDAAFYNLMIIITVLIALTAVINIAIMFRYILMKRKKQVGVFKICGCPDMKIIINYLCEALFIVIPAFLTGAAVYFISLKPAVLKYFIYLNGAYSSLLITLTFIIFIIISVIVLLVMVRKYIKSLPASITKEGD